MYLSHKLTRRCLEASFGLTTPGGDFEHNGAGGTDIVRPVSVALVHSSVTPDQLRLGTIPPGTEPVPAGYSRQPINNIWADIPITSSPARNSIPTAAGDTITFSKALPADDWGQIGWIVILDVAGNVIMFTGCTPAINMGPAQVNGLTISGGNMQMQFDPIVEPTWGCEQKWRLLRAIGRDENLNPIAGAAGWSLWSYNMVDNIAGVYFFDQAAPINHMRATAVGLYLDYNDAGSLSNSLTVNNVDDPGGPLVHPVAAFPGYDPVAVPATTPVASLGHQPVTWTFVAAPTGSNLNYIQNANTIQFPIATGAWNFGAQGCLAVVNWRYTGVTWVRQRILAVIPATNWTVGVGNQLTIPVGGLKLRAD